MPRTHRFALGSFELVPSGSESRWISAVCGPLLRGFQPQIDNYFKECGHAVGHGLFYRQLARVQASRNAQPSASLAAKDDAIRDCVSGLGLSGRFQASEWHFACAIGAFHSYFNSLSNHDLAAAKSDIHMCATYSKESAVKDMHHRVCPRALGAAMARQRRQFVMVARGCGL